MAKILPILKTVGRILMIVLFLVTVGTNLAVAYIVFAPDTMAKPFYLEYSYPAGGAEQTSDSHGGSTDTSHTTEPPVMPVSDSEHAPIQVVPKHLEPGHGIMIDIGKKVINLAEPDGRTYIQVRITLEFAPGDPSFYMSDTTAAAESSEGGHGGEAAEGAVSYEATFTEEVQTKLPVINDLIISLISSKKFEDVYTSEGKEMLRNEIATQINNMLPDYHISYVYFTEFVVQ